MRFEFFKQKRKIKNMIKFEDFKKLDLRVGKVIEVEQSNFF